MKIINTPIKDLLIIQPQVFRDERGYFFESFNHSSFVEAGLDLHFVQDNESKSSLGVLRGLHSQLAPAAQTKLVRVIKGKVLDVAVDIRAGSPTFGQHVSVELSEQDKRQLLIPRGFAHGFVVLENDTIFAYKIDNYYSPENDRGLAFDDPAIGINWIVDKQQLQLSAKDLRQPSLEKAELFDFTRPLYV